MTKINGSIELKWTLEDATLTISGNGPMPAFGMKYNLVPWYPYINGIKEVIIKRGVTSIGPSRRLY
jgi:hypothetical protein